MVAEARPQRPIPNISSPEKGLYQPESDKTPIDLAKYRQKKERPFREYIYERVTIEPAISLPTYEEILKMPGYIRMMEEHRAKAEGVRNSISSETYY